MSLSVTIDAMLANGCSAEQIAAVVRAHEQKNEADLEARRAAKRQANTQRQRRYRNAHNAVTERDSALCGVTARDTLSPDKENPPHPLKKLTPIPTYVGDDATRDRKLEADCRSAAGELPVLIDTNFAPVLVLLDAEPALTGEDAVQAVRNAVEAQHRLRFWSKLEPWIRRAARDRLENAMAPANYARAGPDGKSTPRQSERQGKPDGTPKTPSDFLRAAIRARASDDDGSDQKLLTG